MKKVLIVADTNYPRKDGVLRFIEELLPKIKEKYEVRLLLPDYGAKSFDGAILVKTSKIIKLSEYKAAKLNLKTLSKVKKAVKWADTVFVQGPAQLSFISIYYAKRYKKSVVTFTHHMLWELYSKHAGFLSRLVSIFVKKLSKWYYNAASAMIVPYKSIIKSFEIQNIHSKFYVAELGVGHRFCSPNDKNEAKAKVGIDSKEFVIGYVGRIMKEKNVKALLEAFEKLRSKRKATLLVVGSGSRKDMEMFRHAKNTMVVGQVDEPIKYYQAMDVFVMPSLTETTSLSTLEAMACGVPVITTRVGFLKEYVVKEHNGLLFPKGNPINLAKQLNKVITRPNLRESMGKNAIETAKKFSWDKTAAKVCDVLDKF